MLKRLKLLIPLSLLLTACQPSLNNTCPPEITDFNDINDFIHYADIDSTLKLSFTDYNSYYQPELKKFTGWYYLIEDTSLVYSVYFIFYKDQDLLVNDLDSAVSYPLVKEDQSYGYDQVIDTTKVNNLEASTRTTYYGVANYQTPYYYEISLVKDNTLYYIQFMDAKDFNIQETDITNVKTLFNLFINRIEPCLNKID